MLVDNIRDELFALRDVAYRDFQIKLIPTVNPDSVIGIRTPELRKLAKQLSKRNDIREFLDELPHRYFDEDQLHAFIISGMKDYGQCIDGLNKFLPYVNNWATCDQMSPKIFKKCHDRLPAVIKDWLGSNATYTVRFGIGMLMEHFLDADFDAAYPKLVAEIRSEEYYINMMRAWYFATALAKQYESVLPYIEDRRLDTWTHNKTIQKSVESYRITPEQKAYLKTLKVRSSRIKTT